jgi:hypothetical protein
MITKYKTGFRRSRNNCSSLEDFDYEGDSFGITPAQRGKIISYYFTNIQDSDDREAKISELEGLSSGEANQILLDFETCSWNTIR